MKYLTQNKPKSEFTTYDYITHLLIDSVTAWLVFRPTDKIGLLLGVHLVTSPNTWKVSLRSPTTSNNL